MVQVMVWKLDSTELEFALFPGATVLDLQTAVSMLFDLLAIFIELVSNGGESCDSTATVVESIVEGLWKLTELISLSMFLMNNSIGAV